MRCTFTQAQINKGYHKCLQGEHRSILVIKSCCLQNSYSSTWGNMQFGLYLLYFLLCKECKNLKSKVASVLLLLYLMFAQDKKTMTTKQHDIHNYDWADPETYCAAFKESVSEFGASLKQHPNHPRCRLTWVGWLRFIASLPTELTGATVKWKHY